MNLVVSYFVNFWISLNTNKAMSGFLKSGPIFTNTKSTPQKAQKYTEKKIQI